MSVFCISSGIIEVQVIHSRRVIVLKIKHVQVIGCVKEGHLLEIFGWYRNMISLGVLLHFNKYPTCGTFGTKNSAKQYSVFRV